jgi:quinol monooxygenase YgiN
MLTVVLIGRIKPGREPEFEEKIAALFRFVSTEPGSRGVTWGPTEVPGQYALIERYADLSALVAHRATAHMKDHGPALFDLFDDPPTIVRFVENGDLLT